MFEFGHERQILRYVGGYYILLVTFSINAAVTFSYEHLIIGILLFSIYSVVLFFGVSYAPKMKNKKPQVTKRVHLTNSFLLVQIVMLGICLNYVVNFYTGSNVINALINLSNKTSNYLKYQEYFSEAELYELSIGKILPILANVYIKLSFLHSLFLIFSPVSSGKFKVALYFYFNLLILILYSISRGTNIELFEVIFAITYCVSNRNDLINKILRNKKNIFLILIAMIVVLIVFIESVNARAIISCYTNELCIDDSALISKLNEDLAYLTFVLSGYFSFGFYYIGHSLIDVVAGDVYRFLVFPSLGDSISFGPLMCGKTFDCGVNWEPDFSKLISAFGVLPSFIIVFLLGYLLKSKQNQLRIRYNFTDFCFIYLVSLYFISLPIGQLITSSSQNVIILLYLIIFYMLRRVAISIKS